MTIYEDVLSGEMLSSYRAALMMLDDFIGDRLDWSCWLGFAIMSEKLRQCPES